jgi:hypothetical protein
MSVLNSISQNNTSLIEKSFGNHPNGKEVLCYKLTSNNGMELEVWSHLSFIKSAIKK